MGEKDEKILRCCFRVKKYGRIPTLLFVPRDDISYKIEK